jgi:hypothetical protein
LTYGVYKRILQRWILEELVQTVVGIVRERLKAPRVVCLNTGDRASRHGEQQRYSRNRDGSTEHSRQRPTSRRANPSKALAN